MVPNDNFWIEFVIFYSLELAQFTITLAKRTQK